MKLGVISDTHDRLDQFEAALQFFTNNDVQTIIHCGDWKSIETLTFCAVRAHELSLTVYGVLGNNDLAVQKFLDFSAAAPGDFHVTEGVLELTLAGKKLAAYHGHHPPTRRRIQEDKTYDIVLLGHSHKPSIETVDGILVVNPGSTAFAIPRSKTWRPSVAIVDVSLMSAQIHYL